MSSQDQKHRSHLPMPNTSRKGLITFDAKDAASKFPPIERLRPPAGAPNVLIVLIDDVGFGATSAFGGPCHTPTRGETGSGRTEVQSLPHHCAVFAHAPGIADRPQPPLRWHGGHHRDCDGRAGLLLGAAKLHVAAGEDAQAEWLLHRAIRQVSRSARLGNEPGRTVRCLADAAEAASSNFYGFIGGEANQWYPTLYEGDHGRRAGEDA